MQAYVSYLKTQISQYENNSLLLESQIRQKIADIAAKKKAALIENQPIIQPPPEQVIPEEIPPEEIPPEEFLSCPALLRWQWFQGARKWWRWLKYWRSQLFLVVILNIFVLIEAGIYVQKMQGENVNQLQALVARKDDLVAEQQRLELQIAELNKSLEAASANYKTQSDKLAALSAEEDKSRCLLHRSSPPPPQVTIPPPSPVQQAPPPKPAQAPAPAPMPQPQ